MVGDLATVIVTVVSLLIGAVIVIVINIVVIGIRFPLFPIHVCRLHWG